MAFISNEKIEKVRLASDIVDVVSGYLSLKRSGRNYFGVCPFHQEKTPSFSVNPEMQIFHCFGCGAGGNVFTFVMRMEGVTFPESVKVLAQAAGILLPEEEQDIEQLHEKEALFFANKMAMEFYLDNLKNSPLAKDARMYLASRGLTENIFAEFGIGFAPPHWDGLLKLAKSRSFNPDILLKAGLVLKKDAGDYYDRFRGRVTFAIHNLSGQIVAFGARRIVEDDSPKYINSPETDIYQKRFTLYGLYQGRDYIRKNEHVIIVEGYTDLISLNRIDIKNVVATSGTALTEDHARLLRRYTTNAVLMYDSDSAGAAAALRGADLLLEHGLEVKIAVLPQGQDPDEYARENNKAAALDLVSAARPLIEFKLSQLEQKGLLSTITQKAEAARSLLGSVAKMKDQIQRSFVIRDLAEKLHVEESILWAEIEKQNRSWRPKEIVKDFAKDIESKFFETRRGGAELGLLETVIMAPELIRKILANVKSDYISHEEIRELFRQLEFDILNSAEIETQKYPASIKNPYIANYLTNKICARKKPNYTWQYATDCIINLQICILDNEVENIKNRIRLTQSQEGDDQRLWGLYQQREKIKQGMFVIQ